MHTACVAVQSSMFDPLMLCGTGMFQCDSAEVVDAAVKSVLSTPVMMAAAAAAPAIPCDMCENGLPLLKALSPPECQKMMVGAVKDVLQKPCDGICEAALGFACSTVIPAAENNPKFVCKNLLQCAKPANPMPSLYPLDCTACTQLLTLVTSVPADQCPGFLPGVMAANGIPATPQIVNFACKDALPILAKKNPTQTCVGMLKCSVNKPNAALRRAAAAKSAVEAETASVVTPASAAMATASAWFANNYEAAVAISVVCGLALLVLARLLFVKCCTKPLLQVEADDVFSASRPAVSDAAPNAESTTGTRNQSAEVEIDAGGAASAEYAPPVLPPAAAAAEVPLLEAASEPSAGSA